jgi:alkanesulfonate monooxygenase SsuD/methylene tetrahydromethanopterin reductase-like flavin-dependent oxidoreductase (luciferase family)
VGKTFTFEGTYYRLIDSPALPKPAQHPRPPVIIGGVGAKRTPRLAARYADEYNVPFHPLEDTRAAYERVRAACTNGGRHDKSITFSAAQVVCCGRDEAEIQRRADAIGRTVEDLRENGLAGTPAEVVEKIARFGQAGAERIYLQVLDLEDLDHLELLASEVLPQV